MNPNIVDEIELEIAFGEEFKALVAREEVVQLHLTPLQAFSLLSAVQLAFRHPLTAQSPCMGMAAAVARVLQERVATTPALSIVAGRGWNPQYDVEPDDEQEKQGDDR